MSYADQGVDIYIFIHICIFVAVSKKARSQDQPQLSLSEQVEELRAAILERMDQLNTIQQQLRERYVPTSVVSHLQQCVKETEVNHS